MKIEFPLHLSAPLIKTTETDHAYFAGILDREGTLTIGLQRDNRDSVGRYQPIIQIGITNLEILLWAQMRFGGYIYDHKVANKNPRWKQSYVLQFRPKEIIPIADKVSKYMILKTRQIAILREWMEKAYLGLTGGAAKKLLTPEIRGLRDRLHQEIIQFNQKGRPNGSKRAC